MNQPEKLHKLIDRMELLVGDLRVRKDLVIHQRINLFFYMQKIEELKMLLEQIDEIRRELERMSSQLQTNYDLCVTRWYEDARWLNSYIMRERWKSIL